MTGKGFVPVCPRCGVMHTEREERREQAGRAFDRMRERVASRANRTLSGQLDADRTLIIIDAARQDVVGP